MVAEMAALLPPSTRMLKSPEQWPDDAKPGFQLQLQPPRQGLERIHRMAGRLLCSSAELAGCRGEAAGDAMWVEHSLHLMRLSPSQQRARHSLSAVGCPFDPGA